MPPSQDDYIRTALRLPRDLHAEIQDAADAAGRTMNAEIIARLSGYPSGTTLDHIAKQNETTQAMVQRIIDALGPQRR